MVQSVCLADRVWQAQNCGLAGDDGIEEQLKRLKWLSDRHLLSQSPEAARLRPGGNGADLF